MDNKERLDRIKQLAFKLGRAPLSDEELYTKLRFDGFEENINAFKSQSANPAFIAFFNRLSDSNIGERQIVLEDGNLAHLLLFKHMDEQFYHLKINNDIVFHFIFKNQEGKWHVFHPLTLSQSLLFVEIYPFL